MRVAIVGAGAVGSLLAGLLSHGGAEAILIERNPAIIRAIRAGGLQMRGVRGEYRVKVHVQREAAGVGAVELVFLCVKAYDTGAAVDEHRALFGGDALVLSLQNGIGNLEAIAERIGRERLLAGTTTMGATLERPGVCVHAGEGETFVGEAGGLVGARARLVAGRLSQYGVPTEPTDRVGELLWTKLCVNVGINPFAALLGVPNGKLAELPSLEPLMARAVAETVAVAAAEGVVLDGAAMLAKAWQVVRGTANNRGSMLSDLDAGRRTEIDAICGAVVERGRARGIPTPVNEMLTALITARQDPTTRH
jgi:2-dehydropantoate 2-reductase